MKKDIEIRKIFLATLLGGVASQVTNGDNTPDSPVIHNFTEEPEYTRYTLDSSKTQGSESTTVSNLEGQPITLESEQSLQNIRFTSDPGEASRYTSAPDSQGGGPKQQNGILSGVSDSSTLVQTMPGKKQDVTLPSVSGPGTLENTGFVKITQLPSVQQDAQRSVDPQGTSNHPSSKAIDRTPQDSIKPGSPLNPERSIRMSTPNPIDSLGQPNIQNNTNPDYVNGIYTYRNPGDPNNMDPRYGIPQIPSGSVSQDRTPQDSIKPGSPLNPERSIRMSTPNPIDSLGQPNIPNNTNPDYVNGIYTYRNPGDPNNMDPRYGTPQIPSGSVSQDRNPQDSIKPGSHLNPQRSIKMSITNPIDSMGQPKLPNNTNPYYVNGIYTYRNPGDPNNMDPRYGIPQIPSGSVSQDRTPQDSIKPGSPLNPERSIRMSTPNPIDSLGQPNIPNNINSDYVNGIYTYRNPGDPNNMDPRYGTPQIPSGSVSQYRTPQDSIKPGSPLNPERSIKMSITSPIDSLGQPNIPNNINPDYINGIYTYRNPSDPNNMDPRYGTPQIPSGSVSQDRTPQDSIKPGSPLNPERSIKMSITSPIDSLGQPNIPNNINPDYINGIYTYRNPGDPNNMDPRYGTPQIPSGSVSQDRTPQDSIKQGSPLNPERSIRMSTPNPIDSSGQPNIPNNMYPDNVNGIYTYRNPSDPNNLNPRYGTPQIPSGSWSLDGIPQDSIKPGNLLNSERSIKMPTANPIDSLGQPNIPNNINPDYINGIYTYPNPSDPKNLNPRYGTPQSPSGSGSLDRIPQQDSIRPGYPLNSERSIKMPTANPIDSLGQPNIPNTNNPDYINGIYTYPNPSDPKNLNPRYPQIPSGSGSLDRIPQLDPIKPGYPFNPERSLRMSTTNPIDALGQPNIPNTSNPDYPNGIYPYPYPSDPNNLNSRYGIQIPSGSRSPDNSDKLGYPTTRIISGQKSLPELRKFLDRPYVKTADEGGVNGKPDIATKETLDSMYQTPLVLPNRDTQRDLSSPIYNNVLQQLSTLYSLNEIQGIQPLLQQLIQKLNSPNNRLGVRPQMSPTLSTQPIYPFDDPRISRFGSRMNIPQEPSSIRQPGDKDRIETPDQSLVQPSYEPVVLIRKANYISPIPNRPDPKFNIARELSAQQTDQLNPILSQDSNDPSVPQVNQPSSQVGEQKITKPNMTFEDGSDEILQHPTDDQPFTTSDSSKLVQFPGQIPRGSPQNTSSINFIPNNVKEYRDSDTLQGYSGQRNVIPSELSNYPTLDKFGKPIRSQPTSQRSSTEDAENASPDSTSIKFKTIQNYGTPESIQYNPAYKQLGMRGTIKPTPVRGSVEQTDENEKPVDSVSPPLKDTNRPFDQPIDSPSPTSRLITQHLLEDQKSPSPGDTPDSARLMYRRIIPHPSERPDSDTGKFAIGIENGIPETSYLTDAALKFSTQKIDRPEVNFEERSDEDGVIRHQGVRHSAKGYVKYYPSNVRNATDPRYVIVSKQVEPGVDASLNAQRIMSETITNVHNWPIRRTPGGVSTGIDVDSSVVPKVTLDEKYQYPTPVAQNGSGLISAKRFLNSEGLESSYEINLPENLGAERLQTKSAATTFSFPMGGSSVVSRTISLPAAPQYQDSSIGGSGAVSRTISLPAAPEYQGSSMGGSTVVSRTISLPAAPQYQGSSNINTFSYPGSSSNTQYSPLGTMQYISKPVTTQVKYNIVPDTYQSAGRSQTGQDVTSQGMSGLKPMMPMMLNLPRGMKPGVTRGKYSYTGPDGKTVTTHWYVDETGFHVEDNQNAVTEAPKTSSEPHETT
ncbi:hypothetical protein GE061_012635 [Apolygus lucorum]|uniref:Uncharacterized protein n=1 Tax=Apolygus lucorum TaxID=248454 RepID=A0A8S9XU37_APOLU|nr:hypothetical protein GE061_012635 [Apolygus lucorum]